MNEPATGTITTVRDTVAAGRATAEQAVVAALDLIDRHNPRLNAVVALRADLALAEARDLDARLRAGEPAGPLAGVPVLVKDLEDVAGMRTTQGSFLFADASPAEADGLVPSRLRRAGAIVVGKTNLPEFATEGYTSNLVFGTTRNPWTLDWSPGGSSGGSAAALAAGLAPIATATDGGGSIRIPAASCGLLGIKPTNGLIGRRPIPDWIDLSTDGPLATTVEDLRLLLSVEAGPIAGDPTALSAWAPTVARTLPPRALAAPRLVPWGPLPGPVATAFEQALAAFADALGVRVEPIEPEGVFRTGNLDEDWFVLATAEHVARLGRATVKANLERMHPAARAFMEQGLAIGIDEYLAARRRRFGYVRELDELLGDEGIVLTPTVATEGFPADGRLEPGGEPQMLPPDAFTTAVQNMTGHPAISLPAGRLRNGVPFGLMATAPRFRDDLLLGLAAAWEAAQPWPRIAPGYQPFEAALGLA